MSSTTNKDSTSKNIISILISSYGSFDEYRYDPSTQLKDVLNQHLKNPKAYEHFYLVYEGKKLDFNSTLLESKVKNLGVLDIEKYDRGYFASLIKQETIDINVLLRFEQGESISGKFAPSTTLWDFINHWISLNKIPNKDIALVCGEQTFVLEDSLKDIKLSSLVKDGYPQLIFTVEETKAKEQEAKEEQQESKAKDQEAKEEQPEAKANEENSFQRHMEMNEKLSNLDDLVDWKKLISIEKKPSKDWAEIADEEEKKEIIELSTRLDQRDECIVYKNKKFKYSKFDLDYLKEQVPLPIRDLRSSTWDEIKKDNELIEKNGGRVTIRVRFPGEFFMQSVFKVDNCLSDVAETVRDCLIRDCPPFEFFTTYKQNLQSNDVLRDKSLMPSANINLYWKETNIRYEMMDLLKDKYKEYLIKNRTKLFTHPLIEFEQNPIEPSADFSKNFFKKQPFKRNKQNSKKFKYQQFQTQPQNPYETQPELSASLTQPDQSQPQPQPQPQPQTQPNPQQTPQTPLTSQPIQSISAAMLLGSVKAPQTMASIQAQNPIYPQVQQPIYSQVQQPIQAPMQVPSPIPVQTRALAHKAHEDQINLKFSNVSDLPDSFFEMDFQSLKIMLFMCNKTAIRIKFPDGFCIQFVFSVHASGKEVFDAIKQTIREDSPPFSLSMPKRFIEVESDKLRENDVLIEKGLVPSAMLSLVWELPPIYTRNIIRQPITAQTFDPNVAAPSHSFDFRSFK